MKHQKIVNDLVEQYQADANVVGIYVFGSLAKGTAHEQSDIDIEILFKKQKRGYELKKKIIQGVEVDLSCYRLDRFMQDFSRDLFVHYSALDYKIIYDPKGILKNHLSKVTKYFKQHQEILKFWQEKEKKWKQAKKRGKKGQAENYFEIIEELKIDMKSKIRKATKKDFTLLAKIFAEESSKKPYYEKHTLKTALKEIEGFSKDELYVAEIEGALAGFLASHITKDDKHKAYIQELWLAKKYQGKGVGTALVSFIEDYYKKQGVKKIRLVAKRNAKAFSFYTKHNYIEHNELVFLEKKLR